MERINLTSPENKPANTFYQIERISISVLAGSVYIELRGQNWEYKTILYDSTTTPTGATLIAGLNKANLSTRSLNQRIFDRLIADGHLAGVIVGSID